MAGLWQQLLRLTSDPPELSRHAHTDCHVLPYPAFTVYSAVQYLVRYGVAFGALWWRCASSKIAGLPLAKLGGT